MAKDKAQNGFDRIAKMIVKQTDYIKNNKTGADLAVRLGALKTSDGNDLSTTTEIISTIESTFKRNSDLLVRNDEITKAVAYIGYKFKDVQEYGSQAIGPQYYGAFALGEIQIGSVAHSDGDGLGNMLHGGKQASFEEIIDSVNNPAVKDLTALTTQDEIYNAVELGDVVKLSATGSDLTSIYSVNRKTTTNASLYAVVGNASSNNKSVVMVVSKGNTGALTNTVITMRVGTPVSDSDAATKKYVDEAITKQVLPKPIKITSGNVGTHKSEIDDALIRGDSVRVVRTFDIVTITGTILTSSYISGIEAGSGEKDVSTFSLDSANYLLIGQLYK